MPSPISAAVCCICSSAAAGLFPPERTKLSEPIWSISSSMSWPPLPFHAFAAVGTLAENIDTIPESYAKAFALINTAGYNSPSSIRWADDAVENEALLLPHIEFDQLIRLNEKIFI